MAAIAGIEIRDPTVDSPVGGAAFEISSPANRDFTYPASVGEGVLKKGSSTCVVHLGTSAAPGDLLVRAAEVANKTLDLDGFTDGRHVRLVDCFTDHVLWWIDDAGESRIRLQSSAHLGVHVSVSATATYADGSTEDLDPYPSRQWHRSMRFHRFSQTTQDLFESYRYLFLAVEAALNERWPKRSSEGELAWFKRCNRELETLGVDFTAFGPSHAPDAVAGFSEEQYKSFRCALFHSKDDGSSFLPGGPSEDRALVLAAISSLGLYLRDLYKYALGVQQYSGGVTLHGIRSMSEPLEEQLVLGVTEDNSPVQDDDIAASPKGLPVSALHTRCLGVVDGIGYVREFAGELRVEQLASNAIRRCASWTPDALMTVGSVEDLHVQGFDVFEHRLKWHHAKRWGGLNARFKY